MIEFACQRILIREWFRSERLFFDEDRARQEYAVSAFTCPFDRCPTGSVLKRLLCKYFAAQFCAAGVVGLTTSPAFASDPAGTFSFLYTFGIVLPWAVISFVVMAIRVSKRCYRSLRKARVHAAIGGAIPLTGLAVTAFDFFVVRSASTPWPGIETILICGGLCILACLAGLLPLLSHYRLISKPD